VTLNTSAAIRAIGRRGAPLPIAAWLDREDVIGYVLMTPALLLLTLFIAYPFVVGVWYSLSDVKIIGLGDFIGLKNYGDLLQSPVFQQTVKNSFVYTGAATVFKLGLGLGLALLMNQHFPF
jgi:multiple sugar transport system permease protein